MLKQKTTYDNAEKGITNSDGTNGSFIEKVTTEH